MPVAGKPLARNPGRTAPHAGRRVTAGRVTRPPSVTWSSRSPPMSWLSSFLGEPKEWWPSCRRSFCSLRSRVSSTLRPQPPPPRIAPPPPQARGRQTAGEIGIVGGGEAKHQGGTERLGGAERAHDLCSNSREAWSSSVCSRITSSLTLLMITASSSSAVSASGAAGAAACDGAWRHRQALTPPNPQTDARKADVPADTDMRRWRLRCNPRWFGRLCAGRWPPSPHWKVSYWLGEPGHRHRRGATHSDPASGSGAQRQSRIDAPVWRSGSSLGSVRSR